MWPGMIAITLSGMLRKYVITRLESVYHVSRRSEGKTLDRSYTDMFTLKTGLTFSHAC